jgi:dihydroflavonol-4-reductase
MKCAVLGATGFLGTNLVNELRSQGHWIRAVGLAGSETKYIKNIADELMDGDITDSEDMQKTVEGCEVVFLVAADTSFWSQKNQMQYRINAIGPEVVGDACVRRGVRRIVHTATTDTFGFDPSGRAIDENFTEYNLKSRWLRNNYADTKRLGLKRIMAKRAQGLEVVAMHPGNIVGPYDFTLQWGRIFFDMRDGKLPPGVPKGSGTFAHSQEVARAHIAAAQFGRDGESYLLGGIGASWREFFDSIGRLIGKASPRLDLPKGLLIAYGFYEEWQSYITKKRPQLSPGQAYLLCSETAYDSSKAIRELGFKQVSITKMLSDALDWYKKNDFYK